jgi:hypothetical protein
MRSVDGGLSWEDRKPGAQPDAHTLRAHRLAPGRVYEAAGGGYAETEDGGVTWHGEDTGLGWHYLWGLAVDPADPDTMIVSVSPGPRHAHDPSMASSGARAVGNSPSDRGTTTARPSRGGPPWAGYAYQGPEAAIYRRTRGGPWQEIRDGLPEPRGTLAYVLATHDAEPHVFYGIPHGGEFYRSADGGLTWEHLPVEWPEGFHVKSVDGLAVGETT